MDVYDHLDRAKILVELAAEFFNRPSSVWRARTLLFTKSDTMVIDIPPEAFESDQTKDALALSLERLIGEERAHTVVMIQEAWVADRADGSDLSPARDDPNRVESLTITVLRAYEHTGSIAPILRKKDQPPRLGEWEDSGSSEMDGRFVDPLVAALRAVVKAPDA